ncbi:MAG: aldose 1-epimerase [Pseudomonadota bacterium]
MTADPVRIIAADMELELLPDLGGSVGAFRAGGRDVLRPADADPESPLEAAGFPMLPFCGRIENGRFDWAGRQVALPPGLPPEPHAIHGQGWQRRWTVERHEANEAVLALEHPAGDWPWRYTARQHFRVDELGLTLVLSLCNDSDTPMPAGMGWHPYFPAHDAMLQAETRRIYARGETGVPEAEDAPDAHADLRNGRRVCDLDLDDVFRPGTRAVRIETPANRWTLAGDTTFGWLTVYTPPGESFFCVEPVSHVPNAVRTTDPAARGLRTLAPGETLSGTITLQRTAS